MTISTGLLLESSYQSRSVYQIHGRSVLNSRIAASRNTIFNTVLRCAPGARRTPISRVLLETYNGQNDRQSGKSADQDHGGPRPSMAA